VQQAAEYVVVITLLSPHPNLLPKERELKGDAVASYRE